MSTEALITLGYYLSSLGFLVATIITAMALPKLGKSAFASIFSYILLGTGTFFVITVFQKLGPDFFHIADTSMDIWWHIMFYLAMFSYYFGFKALVSLASGQDMDMVKTNKHVKAWAAFSVIVLVLCFLLPSTLESWVNTYTSSPLASWGLHHFIAFILAGIVGYYLLSAKKNLGQIGRAIASPMIIAIWALALQHFWELLNESWKVIIVTDNVGEGVEKIFLTIASICVIYSVIRLKALAKA